jgi:hypothetical protein
MSKKEDILPGDVLILPSITVKFIEATSDHEFAKISFAQDTPCQAISIAEGPRRISQLNCLEKLNIGFCRARKVTSSGI